MSWFAFDGYSVLRFCSALALLLFVYYLLFDRKAKFLHSRLYLLAIVLISAVVSVLRIPVFPCEDVVVYISETAALPKVEQAIKYSGESTVSHQVISEKEEILSVVQQSTFGMWKEFIQMIQRINIFSLLYGVITMVLLLRFIWSVASIIRLKKWASCYRQDGILIVKNNRVSSPFSFLRMIFINRKLEGGTLDVILSHENSHIQHKHYMDTLLVELYCIFFWFNPFVWLVKRELKALHEFEVDRCLLTGGIELSKYQHIIFDELMGHGPAIANGFHNSMIKKRFIMMKETYTIRYRLLRKVMILPVFAGVITLFAFTEKQAVKQQIFLPEMVEVPEMEIPITQHKTVQYEELMLTTKSKTVTHPIATVNIPNIPKEIVVDKLSTAMVDSTVFKIISVTNVETVAKTEKETIKKSKTKAPFIGRDGITFYPLREDQVVVSSIRYDGVSRIKCIDTDENETRVTIVHPIHFNSNWIHFNKGYSIVDRKTGDVYVIRSLTRGIELNRSITIENKERTMAEFTMVFPPLKKSVKNIDIRHKFPDLGTKRPTNATPPHKRFQNMRLEDYLPPKDYYSYYDKEGRRIKSRESDYVELTEEQIVVSSVSWQDKAIIKSIATDRKVTKVTVVIPIKSDQHLVQFNKGLCIEDCRYRKDKYKIHSLTGGIELNKTLVVVGRKGEMLEFTMVFPSLKNRAKLVNLYDKYKEESALIPNNKVENLRWTNINIADYTIEGNVYY